LIVSQIAAMAKNRVIGTENSLPWDIPEDMKFFRAKTKGHVLVVGRKTFESFGGALPNRIHFIVTRNKDYQPKHKDCFVCTSVEEAITKAKEVAQSRGDDELFVIGGGEIYKQALPLSDRIYLTEIDMDADGDTIFPEFGNEFELVHDDPREGPPAFRFRTYQKNSI
jgi:dihydrofolate reductase